MNNDKMIANRFIINNPKDDLLGRGSMGNVYRGQDTKTEETVAIKAFETDIISDDPDLVRRFRREGKALRKLNHPNIVKMLATVEEAGEHYLIMEYVGGGSLRDLLNEQKQLPLEQILQIALDLADALTRAHRLNIIHRDLKPGNVLLAQDGTPRLADFGIARAGSNTRRITQTGVILGTLPYLSPEVCQGRGASTRSDIWAFGVMIYEMLSGHPPFYSKNPAILITNILNQPTPRLNQHRPNVPEMLSDLIRRMLEKDPNQRIPSVRLVGAELEAILVSVTGNVPDAKMAWDESINIHNYYYQLQAEPDDKTTSPPPTKTEAESPSLDTPLASPYRGLFHFGPNDADIFFGRETFTQRLIDLLQKRNFIAVLGPSGSGKSSVVLAGLVPKLIQKNTWQFTHFRPGRDPFHALAMALIPLYLPHLDPNSQTAQATKLANHFRDDTLSLATVLAEIQNNNPNSHILLIADQFEELYTLCPDPDIRHCFLDILLNSIQTPYPLHPKQKELVNTSHHRAFNQGGQDESPISLVFTMRADFLGRALTYRPFAEVLQIANIMLGPMDRAELTQAIERPALALDVRFESGLVERILDDVGHKAGNLPLLQFALTLLWDRQIANMLTHAAYQSIGHVEGAIAHHADTMFADLTPPEQEQARQIFIQLVHPGEDTADILRRATKAELGADNWTLVKRLADARLVISSRNAGGEETVEVIHEALIHNWGKLRQWMAEARSFRIWQDRLRIALSQWLETGASDDALLRGSLLTEAEKSLVNYHAYLSQDEQKFIKASITLREHEAKKLIQRQQEKLAAAEAWAREVAEFNQALKEEVARAERETRRANASRLAAQSYLASNEQRHRASSLPLMLAHKAALNTLDTDNYIPADVATTLRQAVDSASPWRMTLPSFQHSNWILAADFSPDGTMLVTASADQTVRLWDIKTGTGLRLFQGHTDWVTSVNFSPNGKMIVTAAKDKSTRLWDVETGAQLGLLEGHSSLVNKACFSPDGQMIATASTDHTARLWDVETLTELQCLEGHLLGVKWVCFSPSGEWLLTASVDQTARLWSVETGFEIRRFAGHTLTIWSANFSPDGSLIVTASEDQTARIWSLASGSEVKKLRGHTARVSSAFFSPDGQWVVTASLDSTARIWSLKTGTKTKELVGHTDRVIWANFSPNGEKVVTISADKTIRVWLPEIETEVAGLAGHTQVVTSAAFSPNLDIIVTTGDIQTIQLWKMDNGEHLGHLEGHITRVWLASFNTEGTLLVTAGEDGSARVWDVKSRTRIKRLLGHIGRVWAANFNHDSSLVVTAGEDGSARIWDVATQSEIKQLSGHSGRVTWASFSPDGQYVVTASVDQTACLWHVSTGSLIKKLIGHTAWVKSANFSPDGRLVVTASFDHTVRIWSVEIGAEIRRLIGHTAWVRAACFSPDGKWILSSSDDHTARIWSVETGLEMRCLEGHTAPVVSSAFSADGQWIITSSEDRNTRVWEMRLPTKIGILKGHTAAVTSANFSPDGQSLITTSNDQSIRIWSLKTQAEVRCLLGHTGWVRSGNISPDGTLLITASYDKTARLWSIKTGAEIRWLSGHGARVNSANFSPDGQWIVTASYDQTARIWPVLPGEKEILLKGHNSYVCSANFSPDGQWIVTASYDQTVRIWDVRSGQQIKRLNGHTARVNAAHFSPDGQWIISAGSDRTARLWSVESGEEVKRFIGHTAQLRSANFSPDGQWIVTASSDQTARIWALETGEEVGHLEGHTSHLYNANFSPNGQWIITASADHTARIWPARLWVPIETMLAQAEALIQREPPLFTPDERERFSIDT